MIREGSPTYGPSKAALEAFSAIMAKDLTGVGSAVQQVVKTRVTPCLYCAMAESDAAAGGLERKLATILSADVAELRRRLPRKRRRTSDSSPAALPRSGRSRSPRGHPTSCGYQRREVDGRAPAMFLMYQAIDPNSPFLDRRSPEPRLPRRGSLVGTMSLAQSATAAPSAPIVAAICAAEILGLAGFSIVPALLPQFIEAWSLTNTQAGWLAGIVSAGYMLAVIPLVSLTDRRPARQIYLASSALSLSSPIGAFSGA